jgi:hypothetical protein
MTSNGVREEWWEAKSGDMVLDFEPFAGAGFGNTVTVPYGESSTTSGSTTHGLVGALFWTS